MCIPLEVTDKEGRPLDEDVGVKWPIVRITSLLGMEIVDKEKSTVGLRFSPNAKYGLYFLPNSAAPVAEGRTSDDTARRYGLDDHRTIWIKRGSRFNGIFGSVKCDKSAGLSLPITRDLGKRLCRAGICLYFKL